jgi:hypothetical protein
VSPIEVTDALVDKHCKNGANIEVGHSGVLSYKANLSQYERNGIFKMAHGDMASWGEHIFLDPRPYMMQIVQMDWLRINGAPLTLNRWPWSISMVRRPIKWRAGNSWMSYIQLLIGVMERFICWPSTKDCV